MKRDRLRAANLEQKRLKEAQHLQELHEAKMYYLRKEFKQCLEKYVDGKSYHRIVSCDEEHINLLARAVGYIIPVSLKINVQGPRSLTIKKGTLSFLIKD
jgi:hypothetical protein